jgi:hypothetical protein
VTGVAHSDMPVFPFRGEGAPPAAHAGPVLQLVVAADSRAGAPGNFRVEVRVRSK